ncbi:MAG: SCO family protein [Burkholderiales bacterium]|nr:SCO family protein [Burkholderiales bacterium]
MTRALGASLVVILAALVVFTWGTDGWRAFTSETARREQVLRNPRPLPAVVLEDQDGRTFELSDYRGRSVAVEFIYTRCQSICRSLGMAFRQIRDAIAPQRLEHELALLSISFDSVHDDVPALAAWASAHGADGRHWRVARVRDPAQLGPLLEAFGVVVIADGLGGYEHNAAIHLLDRDGRLVRIDDIDTPQRFLAQAGLQP